jgi:hypothetical protein
VEIDRAGRCPLAYHVVEYSMEERATVTPEFGNCSRPVIEADEDLLRLRFPRSAAGRAATVVTYLGHGRIRQPGRRDPPEYPDSLYWWGFEESRAIAGMWRGGLFAVGADTTELQAWVATPAGAFVLSRTPTDPYRDHEIRAVLGDSVVMRDFEHNYSGLDTYVEMEGRPVALVSIADGGNGCGSMYRIVSTVGRVTPVLTREFGSCSSPDVRLHGARMDLHFEPYYTYFASESPGFVEPPDEGYRYRGGARVERTY